MDEGWEGRALSSDITPVFKFALPGASAIAFVGLSAAALSESEGIGSLLLALCVGAFLAFVLHEYLLPLKRVVATAHGLNISNYRTSISVPFSEIAAVARAYRRWDIVEIAFRSETPFGRSVVFMAGARFFWLSEHPVVAFLRRRAGLDPAA